MAQRRSHCASHGLARPDARNNARHSYTGDALGGLINASLGNATEFIIAILLLVKCEIRVVQASLLGGLLSNLLLVLGMAFLVGGARYSEQEFQQTAAQLNTNLMTLAVVALVIPSAFAFALESAVGEDKEKAVILQMCVPGLVACA